MNLNGYGIFVACHRSTVFVRVIGRGACRNSEPLRKFALHKLEEGCRQIWVDLRDCEGMDSTFLGVFAGVGLRLLSADGTIFLRNLRPEALKAIVSLGLDQLASIELREVAQTSMAEPDAREFQLLPGTDLAESGKRSEVLERAMLMLECHEDLCRVADSNEERFRDVKRLLREDIARQHGDGWASSSPAA